MIEVVATGFGAPEDVLRARQLEPRPPGPGEVQIELRAIGVNPRDRKVYADPHYFKSHGQAEPQFPLRLGVEAAGVVTAVGAGAWGTAGPVLVGDPVVAFRVSGCYAGSITVAAQSVLPRPANLPWEDAASLLLPGTTAAHLMAAVWARAGETVLVHAAAGGVGLLLLQLARLDGVRAVGTCSVRDFDLVRNCGAEPVAYGPGLLERMQSVAPRGVDAACDLMGTDEAVDVSLALVEQRRRIATVVAFDRAHAEGFQALGGSARHAPEGLALRDAARLRLLALAQTGALRTRVGQVFPLAEAAAAHRLIERGGAGGRIVLLP